MLKLVKFNLEILFLYMPYLVTWIVCRLVSSKFCPLCSANKDSLCWERRTSDNLSISFSFFKFSALTLRQIQMQEKNVGKLCVKCSNTIIKLKWSFITTYFLMLETIYFHCVRKYNLVSCVVIWSKNLEHQWIKEKFCKYHKYLWFLCCNQSDFKTKKI